MQLYKDFAPTGSDPRGLALDDQQNWIVVPVRRNRDSGPLDESSFAAALEILGGESETCEVHRFGHWACGWFEIVIVSPERAAEVEDLESSLENYPVLNDEDFSQREHDDYIESWDNCGMSREFVKALTSNELARDVLDELGDDRIREVYEELTPSGDYVTHESGGCSFGRRIESAAERMSRDQLAELIREARAVVRGGR